MAPPVEEATPAPASARGAREVALVVEDEAGVRRCVRRVPIEGGDGPHVRAHRPRRRNFYKPRARSVMSAGRPPLQVPGSGIVTAHAAIGPILAALLHDGRRIMIARRPAAPDAALRDGTLDRRDDMRSLGVILLLAGVLALVFQGFTYKKPDTVLDVGGVEAKVVHDERVHIPPVAGGATVAAGLVLVLAGRRRGRSADR